MDRARIEESPADLCLSALLDLSESMLDATESEATLHRIASRLAGVMGGDHASLVLMEDSSTRGILVTSTRPDVATQQSLDLSTDPSTSQVLNGGQTVVVSRLLEGVGLEGRGELVTGPVSTTMIPVFLDRRVQGVLFVRHDGERASQLDPEVLRLGRIIANTAGIAVRNARLSESVRDSSEKRHSDRLKAERRIRQIEKYQRFFDFAGDGIVVVDGRGQILFANRAAQSSLGFEAPAITRVTLGDVVAPDGRDVLEAILQGIREGHYHRDLDVPIIRSSGERALLSMTLASLEETVRGGDASGSAPPWGSERLPTRPSDAIAIVSFRDVTATRRLERELQKAQKKLELNERQSAIVELAGAAAHELNQPLTSIIGHLELLSRKVPADSAVRKSIDSLLFEADRMAEIVRKFGQVSRYETKPYLGSTDIVDLDRAALEPGDER